MESPETLHFNKTKRLRPDISILHKVSVHILLLSTTNWGLEMAPISCQAIPTSSQPGPPDQKLSLQGLRSPWRPRLTWGYSDFLRASFDLKTPIRENTVLNISYSQWKNYKQKTFKMASSFQGKRVISKILILCFRDLQDTDLPYPPNMEGHGGDGCVTRQELRGGGNDNPPVRKGGFTGSGSWQDGGQWTKILMK